MRWLLAFNAGTITLAVCIEMHAHGCSFLYRMLIASIIMVFSISFDLFLEYREKRKEQKCKDDA